MPFQHGRHVPRNQPLCPKLQPWIRPSPPSHTRNTRNTLTQKYDPLVPAAQGHETSTLSWSPLQPDRTPFSDRLHQHRHVAIIYYCTIQSPTNAVAYVCLMLRFQPTRAVQGPHASDSLPCPKPTSSGWSAERILQTAPTRAESHISCCRIINTS